MGVSRKNYYKNSFGTWLVLSEQSLFDSNFPGAANLRHRRLRKRLSIFLAIRVGYTTRVMSGRVNVKVQHCQHWEQWLDSNLFVTLPSS